MQFDPKKPYGLIMNHPWARYEQGGMLFDWDGKVRTDDESEEQFVEKEEEAPQADVPINNHEKDFALENARAFLKNILSEGPLTRSAIFRECQANNQDWEKVKTAFAQMEGEKFTRRNVILWKLKAA